MIHPILNRGSQRNCDDDGKVKQDTLDSNQQYNNNKNRSTDTQLYQQHISYHQNNNMDPLSSSIPVMRGPNDLMRNGLNSDNFAASAVQNHPVERMQQGKNN